MESENFEISKYIKTKAKTTKPNLPDNNVTIIERAIFKAKKISNLYFIYLNSQIIYVPHTNGTKSYPLIKPAYLIESFVPIDNKLFNGGIKNVSSMTIICNEKT